MQTFVTSDTHFGHANILHLCKRPFKNIDEHDKALIDLWNSRVNPGDLVIHAGDFSWGNADLYRSLLNGRIIFIKGNHDKETLEINVREKLFEQVHDYLEIRHAGKKIIICHYPMRSWNGSHRGSIMLHGHEHGAMKPLGRSFDVGVDCWNFQPLTLDEAVQHAEVLGSLDKEGGAHHGERAF
jgi:calcineurin-like phosphoesterase family protein